MTDPYRKGLASAVRFKSKRVVKAIQVVVLEGTIENRGLSLITPKSRCVREKEIFEFMVAEDEEVIPGGTADTVRYLGFAEVDVGGSITVGDRVMCEDRFIGRVAGFDETHMPNHQNVVLVPENNSRDAEKVLQVGSILEFHLEENE